MGAEEIDLAISRIAAERRLSIQIVWNASRGLFLLQPKVEVAIPAASRFSFDRLREFDVVREQAASIRAMRHVM